MAHNRLLLGPLNAGLLVKENFHGSLACRLRWLLGQQPPFVRDGLVEIPVYSPLDCDLLGLPRPDADRRRRCWPTPGPSFGWRQSHHAS